MKLPQTFLRMTLNIYTNRGYSKSSIGYSVAAIAVIERVIGNHDEVLASLNKCQNMLLGIAIGDAFGAGYEMKSRSEILAHLSLDIYTRINLSVSIF